MNVADLQRALKARGFDPGPIDGLFGKKTSLAIEAFQRSVGMAADGTMSRAVIAALGTTPASAAGPLSTVPVAWMPDARISRIIVHWTAGANRATEFDREHYHLLIEADGRLVRGIPSIDLNSEPATQRGYAAHTLNCNTGSIGVSLCCMADAVESPFKAGPAPMTREQWDALTPVLADLVRRYGLAVTDKTILSHAEVQSNLGIQQKGKWDVARLAFDPSVKGAKACGDLMRDRLRQALL